MKITYDKLYRYIAAFLTQLLFDLFSDWVKNNRMGSTYHNMLGNLDGFFPGLRLFPSETIDCKGGSKCY